MMNVDESKMADFLQNKGFRVELATENKRFQSKAPDLRVYKNDSFAFFCEVKSIEQDRWIDILLEKAPPGRIVGNMQHDPRYNRISAKIHEAAKQFDSVNPYLDDPNVLAFVNHDTRGCRFQELKNVLTGYFVDDKGNRHFIFGKYSEGRIKAEKYKINLYIWFNESENEPYYFIIKENRHFGKLCNFFDINPDSIDYY